MTTLTWDAATLAAGGQLLLAVTLAVHVLVVRPRAARENLALTARIIGDDVTLDQNHGLLPVRDADVERVRQLLTRVVQDPATAKNVLLAADAELATGSFEADLQTVDRIRVDAYLTRLADACSRYQHDAWPLNGATQLARHAFRPSPGPMAGPPVEAQELSAESPAVDELEPTDDVIDLAEAEAEAEAEVATTETEIHRIDLDAVRAVRAVDDFDATVERAAVVPRPAASAEDFDLDERRITTRLRAQIDLTRLRQRDHTTQVPALPPRWQPPSSPIEK